MKRSFFKIILFYSLLSCTLCFSLSGCTSESTPMSAKRIFQKPGKPLYEKLEEPELFVDLSHWQEDLNIKALADSGVKGVILRLSRYNMDKDPSFDRFYNEARQNNLKIGCYYFMNAGDTDAALSDAEKVIALITSGGYEFDLPVFYDVENEHDGSGVNLETNGRMKNAETVKAFCDKLIENGIHAGYYCNRGFARNNIASWMLTGYPYWGARWDLNDPFDEKEFPNICVWQYSAEGRLPGYDGDLDMDLCLVDFTKKL